MTDASVRNKPDGQQRVFNDALMPTLDQMLDKYRCALTARRFLGLVADPPRFLNQLQLGLRVLRNWCLDEVRLRYNSH